MDFDEWIKQVKRAIERTIKYELPHDYPDESFKDYFTDGYSSEDAAAEEMSYWQD